MAKRAVRGHSCSRQAGLETAAPRHRSPQQHSITGDQMSRIITARAGGVIAAVAVAALALTSCSGGSGGDSASGGAADTAKLIIATDSDQAAFGYDPIRYGSGQRMFFEGIYDSLFVLDQDGKIVPQLVTASEYNEDQTALTLDLDTSAT